MKTKQEWLELIQSNMNGPSAELKKEAFALRLKYYGNKVYLRGLIEFSNYCKNNCFYCGIRAANNGVQRYRLTETEILDACAQGYKIGFRTFVLQGGEDLGFADTDLCRVIQTIKERYPDCAVTLSVGERDKKVYQAFFDAGADRFLLRHETANAEHYAKLHPDTLTLKARKQCLFNLKEIGFQVGAGFMVGSPFQRIEHLAEDLCFLEELQPHMVGIGPFIPHSQTPFFDQPAGDLGLTLTMLTLTRIALPKVLLPATTALATLSEQGRILGFQCGANVVMPNLSPNSVREKYTLYNNKRTTSGESAESVLLLQKEVEKVGLVLDFSRGDSRVPF